MTGEVSDGRGHCEGRETATDLEDDPLALEDLFASVAALSHVDELLDAERRGALA